MTQPNYINRVRRFEDELSIYRKDVEDWKAVQERLERCWAWEDLIAKSSYLYDRILALDSEYRDFVFQHPDAYDEALDNKIQQLANDWLALSNDVAEEAAPSDAEFGTVGIEELKEKMRKMESMLTSDDKLFDTPEMESLCIEAIKDYEQGRTVPFLSIEEHERRR